MSHLETKIVHEVMIAVTKAGGRAFKNVRGGMYPIASIKPLLAAIFKAKWADVVKLARSIHPLLAGLCAPGSSDLIGWTTIIVTPDMVGRKLAIFTAVEVKTEDGVVDPDQYKFIDVVTEAGGFAGVARSPQDALKIMQQSV